LNPKQTVGAGNVNWVNLAQHGINWHRYGDLLFQPRGPHKVPWVVERISAVQK